MGASGCCALWPSNLNVWPPFCNTCSSIAFNTTAAPHLTRRANRGLSVLVVPLLLLMAAFPAGLASPSVVPGSGLVASSAAPPTSFVVALPSAALSARLAGLVEQSNRPEEKLKIRKIRAVLADPIFSASAEPGFLGQLRLAVSALFPLSIFDEAGQCFVGLRIKKDLSPMEIDSNKPVAAPAAAQSPVTLQKTAAAVFPPASPVLPSNLTAMELESLKTLLRQTCELRVDSPFGLWLDSRTLQRRCESHPLSARFTDRSFLASLLSSTFEPHFVFSVQDRQRGGIVVWKHIVIHSAHSPASTQGVHIDLSLSPLRAQTTLPQCSPPSSIFHQHLPYTPGPPTRLSPWRPHSPLQQHILPCVPGSLPLFHPGPWSPASPHHAQLLPRTPGSADFCAPRSIYPPHQQRLSPTPTFVLPSAIHYGPSQPCPAQPLAVQNWCDALPSVIVGGGQHPLGGSARRY